VWGLHRGDDTEPGETRDVVGMEDLGVFDSMTRCPRLRLLPENGLDEIERLAVARVPDGVDGGLEAGLHHVGHERSVEAVFLAAHSAMTWPIRVVFEEPGPARAERAVVMGLHGPRREHPAVLAIGTAPPPLPTEVRVAGGEHRVDPHRQPAFRVEGLQRVHEAAIDAGLVDGDVAVPSHPCEPGEDVAPRIALPLARARPCPAGMSRG
jgi:hypothetical protein